MDECGNYEFVLENNKCILCLSCFIFIYGMCCLLKCLFYIYLLYFKDEKICKLLIFVYFMMCILFFVVVIVVVFVIRIVYYCCKMLGVSIFFYNMMCYIF